MTYFQEMLESEKIIHFSTKGKNRLTNAKRRHFAVLAKNRKDANRMRFVFLLGVELRDHAFFIFRN